MSVSIGELEDIAHLPAPLPIPSDAGEVHIKLTQWEHDLFVLLREVVREKCPGTTLRVAGGWVRDKILGRKSGDIDIAVDTMVGAAFARLVNEHERDVGHKEHNVHVVKVNPEQSKHLETACVRIGGEWIDFVNLRTEQYSDHSRIPTVELGTPEEDAYRRDLTINTLFFNINDERVEDFTGTGLRDLQQRVVRTPLPPRTTFLDDPLRVMRAVRFCSRFHFAMDPSLREAAKDAEVQEALATKISKERIGSELRGMLTGDNAIVAIFHLHDMELLPVVFAPPPGLVCTPPVTRDMYEQGFADARRMFQLLAHERGHYTGEQVQLMMVSALLLPLRHVMGEYKPGKTRCVIHDICKSTLKWSIKLADEVMTILDGVDPVEAFVAALAARPDEELPRDEVGVWVRHVKQAWRFVIDLAICMDLPDEDYPFEEHTKDGKLGEHTAHILDGHHDLVKHVEALGLEEAWKIKPMINGGDVIRVTGARGPRIAEILRETLRWELCNPQASKDDALAWLAATHGK